MQSRWAFSGVTFKLQINLPDSVTKRWLYSLSTFLMGPHCVWLIVVGGYVKFNEAEVNSPNVTMLVELGK